MYTKLLYLLVLALYISNAQAKPKDFRPDYHYLESTNAYYKFHTYSKSWTEAKQKCESEDAKLYYPKNRAEVRAVTNFWKEGHDNVDFVYLGITDLLVKGNFEAIDEGVAYINWHSGEPNDATGNERCVLSNKDGTAIDDDCAPNRAFICKKNARELEHREPCEGQEHPNGFRSDYHYLESPKAYYKIHTHAKQWAEAKQKCESEDAKLYYPKNRDEIRTVTNFWKEGHDNIDFIYVGITDLLVKGNFEAIDEGVAYINWRAGEPNDASGDERCVLSHKDGTALDDRCSTPRAYVCKRIFLVDENCV